MLGKIKYWFKNYWYYYKWGVIIAASFIIIIGICIAQSCSKEKYDVNIVYTGPHIFTVGEKDEITAALEQIMDDYNGDGKKVADLHDLTAFTDEQIEEAVNANETSEESLVKYATYTVDRVRQSFSQVMVSDGYICLLDKYWYDILYEASALVPLSEVLGYSPDNMIDEYSVYLGDMYLYEFFEGSVGKLPSDTIVCFRVMPATSAFTGKKQAEASYRYSMEMLRAMFDFGKN